MICEIKIGVGQFLKNLPLINNSLYAMSYASLTFYIIYFIKLIDKIYCSVTKSV